MGFSDFHPRPARVLADCRLRELSLTHRGGSPVLTREPMARMSTSLPRRLGPVLVLLTSGINGGLRPFIAGSAHALAVSRPVRRSHMFQPACSLTPLSGPFAPKASTRAVANPSRSGCFRLEQQLPGGLSSSHWIHAPFARRTIKSSLARVCPFSGDVSEQFREVLE
jgi:hypothetical protein